MQPILEVYMRCVTWTRDSHGLFDYESKNIAKKNIKTHTGGKIILAGDEIQLVSRNFQIDPSDVSDTAPKPMLLLLPSPRRDRFVLKNDTFVSADDYSSEYGGPEQYEQSMLTVVRNIKSTSNNLVSLFKISDGFHCRTTI